MNPKYLLICQNCGQKHYTDGTDTQTLTEIKSAPLPSRADGKDKTFAQLPKRFRCYTCGNTFKTTKLTGPTPDKPTLFEEPELDSDAYIRQWENESLKSVRNKGKI